MGIKISDDKLNEKFKNHNKWIQSKGQKGTRLTLRNVILTGKQFVNVNFFGADLTGTIFSNCLIINSNFNKTDLSGGFFIGSNILFSQFNNISAGYSNFGYARIKNCTFESSNLMNVNFQSSTIENTSLKNSDIRNSIFTQSKLINTDLENTTLGSTDFADADLSKCINLNKMIHMSKSIFSIDTILYFKDDIPVKFLDKAGFNIELLERFKDMKKLDEDYYSCFISYSTQDEKIVKEIYNALWAADINCWYAPEDLKPGKKLHEQLYSNIEDKDKLIIVLSENSINSEWVKTEIRRAFKIEKETGNQKLFPITLMDFKKLKKWECFDADLGKDLAIELREYFIPSFHNLTSHQDFTKLIESLVLSLKKE